VATSISGPKLCATLLYNEIYHRIQSMATALFLSLAKATPSAPTVADEQANEIRRKFMPITGQALCAVAPGATLRVMKLAPRSLRVASTSGKSSGPNNHNVNIKNEY